MGEGIDIVNLAKTAWEIVKDSKASATAQSAYCQAMPSKTQVAWEDMKGWQSTTFDWPFKMYTHADKLFGWDPSIDLMLHGECRFKGQADGTPGLFLDDFRVSCSRIHVDIPWKVNINASVHGNPYNAGSSTLIGAIQLEVALTYEHPTQSKGVSWRITCLGDGSRKVS